MTLATEVLAHHLRLFGVRARSSSPDGSVLLLCDTPDGEDASRLGRIVAAGAVLLAERPAEGFCSAFGVHRQEAGTTTPAVLALRGSRRAGWSRLRTLHGVQVFDHPNLRTIVETETKRAAWGWLPIEHGGVLFIGTNLAGDLIRYRQGDPCLAGTLAAGETRWGIAGERPNYLFEPQRAGEDSWVPHADYWGKALADSVAEAMRATPVPILPGGAAGAIVLTGDDDQAWLEKYDAQLALIGDAPITYFLHPLTRHTAKTLDRMRRRREVDLGLHPDALDAPEQYASKLSEQSRWYRGLVGEGPYSVRNHGFLNDGYWRHLAHWRREGIVASSNLPGFDGSALNGSFLPARVAQDGALTEHWSVLTAIGDGVVFAGGMSGREAGDCVWRCAERIQQSGIPGVMVLNLHPQNVAEAHEMHLAALEVIQHGFFAWNLRQCYRWFARRDAELASCEPGGVLRRAVVAGWHRISRVGRSSIAPAR
jgi:hypothetical protein